MSFVAACDEGSRGELEAKRIYVDLSGLYYGAMCKSGMQELSELRTRAVRITIDGGQCAVLYLDGVDPQGRLLVYPGGIAARVDCKGIVEKLEKNNAHDRTLASARRICE
ncbi:hypothetical protein [Stenotrophomonas sp.]|uniref:hypothetical protein n=1 Tax=Stenotrophomonas sp. TaxID=69392 RepID=UPI00289B79CC|nr:hypothetical protein [Stenotrophomonas sp.]